MKFFYHLHKHLVLEIGWILLAVSVVVFFSSKRGFQGLDGRLGTGMKVKTESRPRSLWVSAVWGVGMNTLSHVWWYGEAVLLGAVSGRAGTSGWETLRTSVPEKLPTRRTVSIAGHMLQVELHISCPEIHRSHYSTRGVVWHFKNKTKSYIFQWCYFYAPSEKIHIILTFFTLLS